MITIHPTLPQLKTMEDNALRLARKAQALLKPATTPKAKAPTAKGRKLISYVKAHFGSGHWKGLGKILTVLTNDPAVEMELAVKENNDDHKYYPAVPGIFWESLVGYNFGKGLAIIALEGDDNFKPGEFLIAHGGAENINVFRTYDNQDTLFQCGGPNEHEDDLDESIYPHTKAWRPATAAEIRNNFARLRARLMKTGSTDKTGLPW